MPYKERIKKVAANFPGILDSDRLELLNTQLIDLQKKGFTVLFAESKNGGICGKIERLSEKIFEGACSRHETAGFCRPERTLPYCN